MNISLYNIYIDTTLILWYYMIHINIIIYNNNENTYACDLYNIQTLILCSPWTWHKNLPSREGFTSLSCLVMSEKKLHSPSLELRRRGSYFGCTLCGGCRFFSGALRRLSMLVLLGNLQNPKSQLDQNSMNILKACNTYPKIEKIFEHAVGSWKWWHHSQNILVRNWKPKDAWEGNQET